MPHVPPHPESPWLPPDRPPTDGLQTDRLQLRPFSLSDAPAYQIIMGQDAVGEQLPRGRGYTADETDRLLQFWAEHWAEHGYGPWAVIERRTGTLLGHCGLKVVTETAEVELLYALGEQHWGRGMATEAAGACVRWADAARLADHLVGFAKPGNSRSRAVLAGCDFRETGPVHLWGIDLVRYLRPAPPT